MVGGSCPAVGEALELHERGMMALAAGLFAEASATFAASMSAAWLAALAARPPQREVVLPDPAEPGFAPRWPVPFGADQVAAR